MELKVLSSYCWADNRHYLADNRHYYFQNQTCVVVGNGLMQMELVPLHQSTYPVKHQGLYSM